MNFQTFVRSICFGPVYRDVKKRGMSAEKRGRRGEKRLQIEIGSKVVAINSAEIGADHCELIIVYYP